VLSGKGSYTRVFLSAIGQGVSIRNSMSGQAMIDSRILMDADYEKQYISVRLPEQEVKDIWLMSFRLQFHRLAHKMPLAWIKITETENILVYLKKESFGGIKSETVGEFLKRCRASGIRKDISKRIAESDEGRVYLTEIKDLLP